MIRAALILLLAATPAWADSIEVPPSGLSRDAPATFTYRLDRPRSGNGTLAIEWSDVRGRLVERRTQAVTLTNGTAIDFTLDGQLDAPGDDQVQRGLLDLYSILKRFGWFWGAEFGREDAMHFEVGSRIVRDWINRGVF